MAQAGISSRFAGTGSSASRAGRTFELLASNDMREVCMATPAIVNDMMVVRTRTRVYGLCVSTD